MDLLALGGAFLRDKLQSHASTQVELRRGDASTLVYVTRGTSTWDAATSDNSTIQVQSSDYIIAANQFDDFGLPELGDLIIDHGGKEFEMLPINNGQHFRFCDSARTIIRVHTKQVDE